MQRRTHSSSESFRVIHAVDRRHAGIRGRRRRGRAKFHAPSERSGCRQRELAGLEEGTPKPVALRSRAPTAPTEVVDRRVVYLVRTGNEVRASIPPARTWAAARASTPDSKRIECPCHGGMYDATGKVIGGPPPVAAAARCRRASRQSRLRRGVVV